MQYSNFPTKWELVCGYIISCWFQVTIHTHLNQPEEGLHYKILTLNDTGPFFDLGIPPMIWNIIGVAYRCLVLVLDTFGVRTEPFINLEREPYQHTCYHWS